MKSTTAVYQPLAEVHDMASRLFCRSGWAALQCVAICRTLGPDRVLRILEAERRRAADIGCWGDWTRVATELRSLAPEAPPRRCRPRDRRIGPIAAPIAQRAS